MSAADELRHVLATESPGLFQHLQALQLPPDWTPGAEEMSRVLTCMKRNQCRTCEATEPADMKRCSACMVARYCSPACQRRDWAQHKKYCVIDRCLKAAVKEQLESGHVM